MTTIVPRSGHTRRRLFAALLSLVGAALLAIVAGAGPAIAHAALTGSDPKQGAVVDRAPEAVKLTFSEKIALSDDAIRVLDPSGKRVDTGKPRDLSSGSTVQYGVDLHAGLPDGTFTVAYQVVSADSHPISGAYTFSVGAPSDTSVALPDKAAGGGAVGVLYGLARYVSYAGFVLLVGGAAFVLGCWPRGAGVRPVQRLVVHSWIGLTAATLAMLLLRGSYTGSGAFSDVFDLGQLGSVLETKTGAALVSRLLLLAAAALFVAVLFGTYAGREDASERKDLTFGLAIGGSVVSVGLAATWAMAEHASTGIQSALAMPVDVLHLLAAATWLGGLSALLVALYRAPSVEPSAIRRFSRVAFCSVVLLAATGLYQSWRQVGSWSALTGTSYGQLLLVKIGLVAVLVGVAWFSRRWTAGLRDAGPEGDGVDADETDTASDADADDADAAPPADDSVDPERAAQLARQRAAVSSARVKRNRDADPQRAGLRRSVLTEAAVAVVVLAVTTVLTTTEPGRTEEEAAGATRAAASEPAGPVSVTVPFDTGGEDGRGKVLLDVTPGRTGSNSLHLYVETPGGEPLDVPEVKIALTLKAKDIGPLAVTPDRIAEGHWSASGVQIPMAGEWTIAVTVRTSDIDQVTENKNARIG